MSERDRDDLREAADRLDAAGENAADDEATERLGDIAERLRSAADADRGPDHGRLARLTHDIREMEAEVDGEAVAAVGSALSHVRAYRETVEGV
ncbi:hypothetical protein NGM10_16820 (plasmid) [Halorussus salilacus]|uniref:DUF7553 family protein n=1 Tax=Halorussus salilacus TaxID=2953750 RepID=UPI00209CF3E3|nr:hypothetical protein [Halorussus salilacus]USZ69759.1 hypothetical protein NGM10_16820 [Halorussus salilacus]